jgi:uncharacterized protein YjiS (DUF1127 family)
MSIHAHDTSYSRNGLTALAELLGDALALAYEWRDRTRQRRTLMRFDDHLLHELGSAGPMSSAKPRSRFGNAEHPPAALRRPREPVRVRPGRGVPRHRSVFISEGHRP